MCAEFDLVHRMAHLVFSRSLTGVLIGLILAVVSQDLAGGLAFGILAGFSTGMIEVVRQVYWPALVKLVSRGQSVLELLARYVIHFLVYCGPLYLVGFTGFKLSGTPHPGRMALAWAFLFSVIVATHSWRLKGREVVFPRMEGWSLTSMLNGAINGGGFIFVAGAVIVELLHRTIHDDPTFDSWLKALRPWWRAGLAFTLVGATFGAVVSGTRETQRRLEGTRIGTELAASALRAALAMMTAGILIFVPGLHMLHPSRDSGTWPVRLALAMGLLALIRFGGMEFICLGSAEVVRQLEADDPAQRPTTSHFGRTGHYSGGGASLPCMLLIGFCAVASVWAFSHYWGGRKYGPVLSLEANERATPATSVGWTYLDSIRVLRLEGPAIPRSVVIRATGTMNVGQFLGSSGPRGIDIGFLGYPDRDQHDLVTNARHAAVLYSFNRKDLGQPLFTESTSRGLRRPKSGVIAKIRWVPGARELFLRVNDKECSNNRGFYRVEWSLDRD